MRLFVAAELSEDLRSAAVRCVGQLHDRLTRANAARGLRWVAGSNMHLTVWFLGELSEPRAAAVLDALREPLGMSSFDIQVGGFGAFPPTGAPRVIWMGLTAGREALAQAHDLVGARLQPWGFPPDGRAYSAHLTIARLKDVPSRTRTAIRQAVAHETCEAGACTIRDLTVFCSRTAPSGAVYEPLLRVPLQ